MEPCVICDIRPELILILNLAKSRCHVLQVVIESDVFDKTSIPLVGDILYWHDII